MSNTVVIIVGLLVLATLALSVLMGKMFRKAGPNEAIIVYGFRGPRVIKGGGAVIFPVVENSRQLSLELMSFDVAPQQDLYTKQGVAVTVEAVAQIKVRSDKSQSLLLPSSSSPSLPTSARVSFGLSWKVIFAASSASLRWNRSLRSPRWWRNACAPLAWMI